MNIHPLVFFRTCAFLLLLTFTTARGSGLLTQTFRLQPGWNSIYLEVDPVNPATDAAFDGVPVESVWTFQARIAAVDFIQDPSEPIWNRNQWLLYVPTNRFESLNNNLFRLTAQQPYLIKLQGGTPVTWSVTGRPVLRHLQWVPDAYNLRGFPIDSNAPPSFRDFFRPSPAHYTPASGQLQRIYRLNASGSWQLVAPTDLVEGGVAYWVFCRGGSDYIAPLSVRIEPGGESLDYGRGLTELSLRLSNLRSTSVGGALWELNAPGQNALAYGNRSPTLGQQWLDLPRPLAAPLQPGEDQELRLALRRQNMTAPNYESVLDVRDNQGTRFLVLVSGRRSAPDGGGGYAGLWMGTATINGVSEAHSGVLSTNRFSTNRTDGGLEPLEVTRSGVDTTPTPTRSSEFNLRLLIHVDTNGTARLLREVVQLWKVGATTTDTNGNRIVGTPGRPVLVTDQRRYSLYQGTSFRDGTLAARRFSAVGFDFPASSSNNVDTFLNLEGAFAIGTNVSKSFTLDPNFATNPFKHRYHPDHDNLDARFSDFKQEAFSITRNISLEFAASDPAGGPAPSDYGYGQIAGVYRETVTGLHKEPIYARGIFRLRRVSEIGTLND